MESVTISFYYRTLYVDDEANERIRGAAQGLIAFILWGVGAFMGTQLAGISIASHTLDKPLGTIAHDWQSVWIYSAWGAVIVLVIFMIFFRAQAKKIEPPIISGRKQENLKTS